MKPLSKGIKLDKGYIQVRVFHRGRQYTKNFGRDCPFARQLAEIHLAEKRKEILMSKAGIAPELATKKFKEVANIFIHLWCSATDANGKSKRDPHAGEDMTNRVNNALIPFFGERTFHEIRPIDIQDWRDRRVKQVAGTTANREQNILSSIFSDINQWIKIEKIKPFKTPAENPCQGIERAPTAKRERVLTPYELSKLKLAATELGDMNAWENIALAVKTCLSFADLQTLKLGDTVDLNRSKTGVSVLIPIVVTHHPDWTNWRRRWTAIVKTSGIVDVEFRDLRKAGGNLLVGKHDVKLISQYMGHADQKTTEGFYAKIQAENMKALANNLSQIVDSL